MAATRGVSAAYLLLQSCLGCQRLHCQWNAAALELTAVLVAAVADDPIGHRPLVCFSKVLLRLDNAAAAHSINMDSIHLTWRAHQADSSTGVTSRHAVRG